MAKLMIESDGTSRGTKVMTEGGEVIDGITDMRIECGMDDFVKVHLTVICPRVKVNLFKENVWQIIGGK
jgi:hypothetical protein